MYDIDREEGDWQGLDLFGIYRPLDSASNALNALIRVLIEKLPPQQLHMFWYTSSPPIAHTLPLSDSYIVRSRWEHPSPLNTLTFSTLLKQQRSSMHTLNFREYRRDWDKEDLENLRIRGLRNLAMTELGVVDSWSTELLARNHRNLRHLALGSEVDLAREYAKNGSAGLDGVNSFVLADTFKETMNEKVKALHESSTPVVQL